MDFLDPDKKRKHAIRLYIGYFLVAIALTLASLILLYRSYGYDVNRKTGEVVQKGLVFVDAHPESAEIFLNGQLQKDRTDTRMELPVGHYELELKRQGYRSWKRSFDLEGGKIERFIYPTLFPDKLVTKDTQLYNDTPGFSTVSPDRHWALVLRSSSLTAFDVYDISKDEPTVTTINLPANILTSAPGTQGYSLVEWSTNNRHVLLKHHYAGKYEFVVVDRENPAQSYNVNRALSLEPTIVNLKDKSHEQLYVYQSATQLLQIADMKDKKVTPFLNKVVAFKSHGKDAIIYVTDDAKKPGELAVRIREGDKEYHVQYLKPQTEYLLELAKFDGHWFAVVGIKSEGTTRVYKDPIEQAKKTNQKDVTPIAVLRVQDPYSVSFSANARFVAAQGGSHFAVYDAETDRKFTYDTKLAVQPGQVATWMDGHRLILNIDNKVLIFDYDGINMQTLMPISVGHLPLFNRDYTFVYTVASSVSVPNKPALTQTALKVKDSK